MHRDIVFEYPEGSEALAYTEKCAVQGFYIPKRVIAVQGHPEFNGEMVRWILAARFKQGIFSKEVYEEGIERVDRYHDGVVVASAFLRFLLE
jgi:GMP synthase-like glutamine amidotransferase